MSKNACSRILLLRLGCALFVWCILFQISLYALQEREVSASGLYGAAATAHPLATRAAVKMLSAGGNAVDAAVAAAFVLAVVEPSNSGLAGDGYALLHLPGGKIEAWDGSSPPPRSDPSFDHGIGFPSETALLLKLHRDHGTLALPQVMAPAIAAAQRGFVVTGYLETQIAKGLLRFPDQNARDLFAPQGRPIRAGELLKQPTLARTLMRIAADHGESFYRGQDAETMVHDLQQRKSKYSLSDFSSFEPKSVVPVTLDVGDCRLIGTPPPSSAVVAMALAREWSRRNWNLEDPAGAVDHLKTVHALISLKHQKLASCWRDPKQFFALTETALQRGSATYGQLETINESDETEPPEHTTHLVTWDKSGMIVTMTLTLGTHWGTKDYCPLGFFYNSEGALFRHAGHTFPPDYPKQFGPISAKSPVLVLRHQKPLLAIGGAGSNRIVANVGTIIGSVVFGRNDLKSALHAARRFPEKKRVLLEWGVPETVEREVKKNWKQVEMREGGSDFFGLVSAVGATGSCLLGVADYRRDGAAGAVKNDPDGKTRWQIEMLTWKKKALGEQGIAEIVCSPRQRATGWKTPDGSDREIVASGATRLARLRVERPVPAFRVSQVVTIDPNAPGYASNAWDSPNLWKDAPELGERERQMSARIPVNLSARQVVEWLMIEIGHGIPYRALPGRMSGEKLLELGYGDCSGKARLFCDLARHRGIPCRLVGGVLLKPGFVQKTHVWCEVWLDHAWVPVCPTNQIFGRLPAHWLIMRYGESMTLEKPGSLIFRVRKPGQNERRAKGDRHDPSLNPRESFPRKSVKPAPTIERMENLR